MKWKFLTAVILISFTVKSQANDFAMAFGDGSQSHIGLLVNGTMGITSKITIARNIGVKYIRDGFTLVNFNGNLPNDYENWYDSGFHVLYNIQWKATNPATGYPTNENHYRDTLGQLLDLMSSRPPELLVCENEEQNDNNFTAPITNYFNELSWFVDEVHARGWKATNGGLTQSPGLDILVYRELKNTYGKSVADAYGAHSMTSGQIDAANNPGSNTDLESKVSEMSLCLQTYTSIGVDYINIHMSYEKNLDPNATDTNIIAKDVMRWRQWYIQKATGLPVISNELGQSNYSAPLVTAMLRNFTALNFPYVIWFDGEGQGGVGAHALHSQTAPYTLFDNGLAFQAFMLGGALP